MKKKMMDILFALLVVVTICVAIPTLTGQANALPRPQDAMDSMDSMVHVSRNMEVSALRIEDDIQPCQVVINEDREVPVPTEVIEEIEEEYVELVPEIPQWYQTDYPDVWYGPYGTVASHGCGLVCLAMVTSYLTDDPDVDIVEFADRFGAFNTKHGSYWSMFELTAEELGLEYIKQTYDWTEVEEALLNGQPVVCLQHQGIFTNGGHFIVLERFTEDGLVVVRDPNKLNYEKMKEGYDYGFHVQNIRQGATTYFIYGAKSLPEVK